MTDLFAGSQRPRLAAGELGRKLEPLRNPPKCSHCGARMRLARIEPGLAGDEITYDCTCGHQQVEVIAAL
jgi:hypothetical protein